MRGSLCLVSKRHCLCQGPTATCGAACPARPAWLWRPWAWSPRMGTPRLGLTGAKRECLSSTRAKGGLLRHWALPMGQRGSFPQAARTAVVESANVLGCHGIDHRGGDDERRAHRKRPRGNEAENGHGEYNVKHDGNGLPEGRSHECGIDPSAGPCVLDSDAAHAPWRST